jgi:hypothetical protein
MDLLSRRRFLKLLPFGGVLLGITIGRAAETIVPAEEVVPDWLMRWRSAQRRPIWEPSGPLERALLAAIQSGQTLPIRYHGGSTPGENRDIAPALLFEVEGYHGRWVQAWCHRRGQQRIFSLFKLEIL